MRTNASRGHLNRAVARLGAPEARAFTAMRGGRLRIEKQSCNMIYDNAMIPVVRFRMF